MQLVCAFCWERFYTFLPGEIEKLDRETITKLWDEVCERHRQDAHPEDRPIIMAIYVDESWTYIHPFRMVGFAGSLG